MNTRETIAVTDMPRKMRAAMIERGHSDWDELTTREAFGEFTAWHLGDPLWGWEFVDLHDALLKARTAK